MHKTLLTAVGLLIAPVTLAIVVPLIPCIIGLLAIVILFAGHGSPISQLLFLGLLVLGFSIFCVGPCVLPL
jgi:hypothetical protein